MTTGIDGRRRNTRWGPELRQLVRGNLSSFSRRDGGANGRKAAVALVLLKGHDGEASLPIFLRSSRLSRHSGQMGLPGGRLEAGEDAPAAALRELHEELGILAERKAILGTLDDFPTRSGFLITPIVIWSATVADALAPTLGGEIARLYVVSLAELQLAVNAAAPGPTPEFCLPFAWGCVYAPTAAILFQFTEVALNGQAIRVGDFYQPPFTWR